MFKHSQAGLTWRETLIFIFILSFLDPYKNGTGWDSMLQWYLDLKQSIPIIINTHDLHWLK